MGVPLFFCGSLFSLVYVLPALCGVTSATPVLNGHASAYALLIDRRTAIDCNWPNMC
jgi:hypothetical protein